MTSNADEEESQFLMEERVGGKHQVGSNKNDRDGSDVCCGVSVLVFVVFFVASIAFTSSVVIPPGEIGIVVTLGHVQALPPGLHFRKLMISSVVRLSGKTQLLEQENVIPTKEGLSVKLATAM